MRIVIEAKDGKMGVQSNCLPPVTINLLKDAIVAVAQQMVRNEDKSLVKPIGALHRLPSM